MKLWELLAPSSDQLTELLNQPLDWEWVIKGRAAWHAWFYTQDDQIEVSFYKEDGETDIAFTSKKHGTDPTGSGDQFKVLSTIVDITKSYLSGNQTSAISFSAKGTSRVRLYRRFAKMMADRLGWETEETTEGSYQFFQIRPKTQIYEEGKIVPNVNTTVDVQPGETQRQAAKFGNKLDSDNRPPLLRGSYGDDSARFSANQGDPFYGPDGTRLPKNKKWS